MRMKDHRVEYKTWHAAKQRCTDPEHHAYNRYGGRGIFMCERWMLDWRNFVADMGRRPDGTSLERVDNNGPYSPENCVWATPKEQQNNTSHCVKLAFAGEELTISQWAERLGVDNTTISSRLKRGWPLERVLSNGKLRRDQWAKGGARKALSIEHRQAISKALLGVPRRKRNLLEAEDAVA
jgi:hypothetical protein